MFTGIVEEVGKVKSIHVRGDGIRFVFKARRVMKGLRRDNSIAVNGTCLTVVDYTAATFSVDAVKETLLKTSLGQLVIGSRVNLERPLSLQQRLGGHLVQGHIDATGTIVKKTTLESSWMFTIRFDRKFRKYLIPVGSITVDGVSLTVARLRAAEFDVAIIPYTMAHTVFQSYKSGSRVNLEFDLVGKYVESLLGTSKR
ncbi:MAG: riboflavin synthase [Ignavibacteriales bacterium]|nr:riboflavin synthase [Ignavibacteriales bacterium]